MKSSKTKLLTVFLILCTGTLIQAQQVKVVTIIESIIPMGVGRSRIIENTSTVDAAALTTERKKGTDSEQGKVKRSDIKIDDLKETKLLNFFSLTGINFQNIASNDAVITSKINEFLKEGWKLSFVVSGVESDAGDKDGNGIFITRLFFSKD